MSSTLVGRAGLADPVVYYSNGGKVMVWREGGRRAEPPKWSLREAAELIKCDTGGGFGSVYCSRPCPNYWISHQERSLARNSPIVTLSGAGFPTKLSSKLSAYLTLLCQHLLALAGSIPLSPAGWLRFTFGAYERY